MTTSAACPACAWPTPCPAGSSEHCAHPDFVFGVPRDVEADDRLRRDLAAVRDAEREALRRD